MASIPEYMDIPACAHPIDPTLVTTKRPYQSQPAATASTTTAAAAAAASFPPSYASAPSALKKSAAPTASLSSNVSDMLLSSLLPPNLPKIQPRSSGKSGPGRPLELTSQREALSLPLVSNNFRRFVTKVGPVFWLQDRVEEVLFWRKPRWTMAYLVVWTCISFKPKLLLLLPSATLLLVLLHIHENTHSIPSLLGVTLAPAPATHRVDGDDDDDQGSFTASNGPEGETPVVPPKEAESAVDYYMNLQAIQNLMGLVSDVYDWITPRLALLSSPSDSPTTLPITATSILLLLLPPTLLLPLTPDFLMPYLLLPIGYVPPLVFHPTLIPFVVAAPRNPTFLKIRAHLEKFILTDALPDEIGQSERDTVEVWENERLDPAIAAKPPSGAFPQGAWSSRFLRAGERAPWVKVYRENALWKQEVAAGEKEGMVLALEEGWNFIPGEEWRVDVAGFWSSSGTDDDGWCYTDDSWQNPSPTSSTEAEVSADKEMPGLALRRITRRRKWWRRVYRASGV